MDKIIIKMKKEVSDKIIEICDSFNNAPGELINVLHQTQDFLGYLPAEAQELIAERLHIPTAKVYGVVSFYSFFTMVPKGKYPVSVCMGTACYVRGGEKILESLERTGHHARRNGQGRRFLPHFPALRRRLRSRSRRPGGRQSLWPPRPRQRQGYCQRIQRQGKLIFV